MPDSISPQMQSNENRMFFVKVGELRCCIDLKSVVRVVYLMELQSIPQSPPFIKGIFNLKGESIFAIDLSERLGIPDDKPYTIDTPVLICHNKGQTAGIILNNEPCLAYVDEGGLRMGDVFKIGAPFFHGVANTDRGLSLVLDIEQILKFDMSIEECLPVLEPDKLLEQAAVVMSKGSSGGVK